MAAKQLNIFDVLRGLADANSETYKATIKILTNFPKDIPPPSDGYIPPLFNEAQQPPNASAGIRIPNPPPIAISWLSRNWPWLLLVAVVIGIIIYLYMRNKRKRREEEEFRKREGERLPKIHYPWPNEAAGPIIEEPPSPVESNSMDIYFEELDRETESNKNIEPPREEPPVDVPM